MEKKIVLSSSNLQFTTLDQGEGEVIFFLHGFPDTNLSFQEHLQFFNQAGFRTIAPLLRGYEPSSLAKSYYMTDIANDILNFIKNLGLQKVHLVGHDWGAVATYAACILYPEYFYSATTIAVPHIKHIFQGVLKCPQQILSSWYILFFQLYGISEYTIRKDNFVFLEKLWADWSPNYKPKKEYLDSVKQTFSKPGVINGTISYYRNFLDIFSQKGKQVLNLFLNNNIQVPLLAIHGENDGCIDKHFFNILMKKEDFSKGMEVQKIPNAGHFVHLEKPEIVNQLILDWIRSK